MTAPVFSPSGNHAIRRHHRKAKSAGRTQYFVAATARTELGIQVLGSAEPKYLLEKADVARDEDETVSVR
jgi:hypothetical protein